MGGAPTLGSLFTERIVVGVGDVAVSNSRSATLSTYALGSCVGVVAYDSAKSVGGLLHIMLPDSSKSQEKARRQPSMFADSGLAHLFKSIRAMGSDPRQMRVLICGGASVLSGQDMFKIGKRNGEAVQEILRRERVGINHCDLGGLSNRTVHLSMQTGQVSIKMPEGTKTYALR